LSFVADKLPSLNNDEINIKEMVEMCKIIL
jgi:hypothetical protein